MKTTEFVNFQHLQVLAEEVRGSRTALRKLTKELNDALTPVFAGAGIEVAYQAWTIQKYSRGGHSWWGIWFTPDDVDAFDSEDRYSFGPLQAIEDAPHEEIMSFVEKEGEELFGRYIAELEGKAPQIKADITKLQGVLATLS